MELADEFEVPLGVPETWSLLTDVGRIAPCLPGARLDEVVDGEFRGVVRVKVGPITVEYKGVATFTELDEQGRRVVLRATGRETRGQGNASATVTATLEPAGDSTVVAVLTELDITGRVAQFGRGALADVSSKLLGQFVRNLERDLATGGDEAPASREGKSSAPAAPAAPNTQATPAATSERGEADDITTAVPVVPASNGSAPDADHGGPRSGPDSPATASTHGAGPSSSASTGRLILESADNEPIDIIGLTMGSVRERIGPLVRRVAPLLVLAVVAGLVRRARRGRR